MTVPARPRPERFVRSGLRGAPRYANGLYSLTRSDGPRSSIGSGSANSNPVAPASRSTTSAELRMSAPGSLQAVQMLAVVLADSQQTSVQISEASMCTTSAVAILAFRQAVTVRSKTSQNRSSSRRQRMWVKLDSLNRRCCRQ